MVANIIYKAQREILSVEVEMSKVEEVIKFYRRFFHILGIWPNLPLTKWHYRGSIFAFIFLLVYPVVMCCLSLLQVESVEEFARAIIHIIALTWAVFINASVVINIPKVEKFLSELCETVYEDDDAQSFVDEACFKALKISKLVMFCVIFTASFAVCVIPLVFGCLPFPMWTPEWANSTVIFSIYWIIEWLTFNYCCLIVNILLFGFAILVIINGYGQFLNVRLSMLVSTEDHDGYQDLVKCIQAHQKFKQMVEDFKTIWGAIIGIYYKAVVVMIGACIFVITKGEDQLTFRENLMFYVYISLMVICIFILSYFGDMIYSTSSQFLYDLFSSDWVDADMKYKKTMIIVMENMKQPVKLSVLFYHSVNLQLFQDTVNEGYSMYSVFQNLKKKINT